MVKRRRLPVARCGGLIGYARCIDCISHLLARAHHNRLGVTGDLERAALVVARLGALRASSAESDGLGRCAKGLNRRWAIIRCGTRGSNRVEDAVGPEVERCAANRRARFALIRLRAFQRQGDWRFRIRRPVSPAIRRHAHVESRIDGARRITAVRVGIIASVVAITDLAAACDEEYRGPMETHSDHD